MSEIVKSADRRNSRPRNGWMSDFDRWLVRMKNDKVKLTFFGANFLPDGDGEILVTGFVKSVDRYMIEVLSEKEEIWVNKSHVAICCKA